MKKVVIWIAFFVFVIGGCGEKTKKEDSTKSKIETETSIMTTELNQESVDIETPEEESEEDIEKQENTEPEVKKGDRTNPYIIGEDAFFDVYFKENGNEYTGTIKLNMSDFYICDENGFAKFEFEILNSDCDNLIDMYNVIVGKAVSDGFIVIDDPSCMTNEADTSNLSFTSVYSGGNGTGYFRFWEALDPTYIVITYCKPENADEYNCNNFKDEIWFKIK